MTEPTEAALAVFTRWCDRKCLGPSGCGCLQALDAAFASERQRVLEESAAWHDERAAFWRRRDGDTYQQEADAHEEAAKHFRAKGRSLT